MNPLHKRLAALRRRLKVVVTFRGVCWLVSMLLLSATLAGVLDWRIHLPGLVRAVLLVGTLAGAGVILYRGLLRPLTERSDDLSLALRIEAKYPALNDSLGSTVQFLEQASRAEKHADSSSLRLEAVRRALKQAEGCNFNPVVDTRGVGAAGASLAGTGVLAVSLILMNPTLAWTALERLAMPFGTTDWPRQTRLEVSADSRAARGEPFEIRASLAGVIPESAAIVFEGLNLTRQHYPVRRDRDGAAGHMLARLERVERTFRFQVQANDALSDWHSVTVQPPPVLVPFEGRPSPQVRLHYPKYTDLADLELADGAGNIEAVHGTRVSLRAAADRPLARAWIEYRPDLPGLMPATFVGLLGTRHVAGVLALAGAGQELRDPIPARLDPDGRSFHVDFTPCVRGLYALRFEDTYGLSNTRLFDLRLLTDPAPVVHLERPSPSRDHLHLLPRAQIALQVSAEDAPYAIRAVYLNVRCKSAASPVVEASQRLPLYDHATMGKSLPRLLSGMAPELRLRPPRLALSSRLALSRIKHADGGDLREGDTVILQAAADDFDDVAIDKTPGYSQEVELHIVGRPTLEALLNRAQTQVQEELLRLRKEQQEALERVIGAEQRWRNTGKLRPQDIDQLLQAEQLQRQIRDRVGTRQEGLQAAVARILRSLRDNRLPRSGTHDRMETVSAELERLAREELEQIEPRLTNARKENESAQGDARQEAKGPLAEARAHQEEVENTLNELLRLLEPWGNVSAVKGETKSILQELRKLHGDVQNIENEGTRGKEREALGPDQQAALDRAAELQRKLEERTGQLLDKMKRMGEDLKEKDPQAAEALREAGDKGRQGTVKENLRSAGQNIRGNKLGEARARQQAGMQTLEEMIQSLDERREEELDRLRKKLKEVEEKMDDVRRRQDELRKKSKEAGQIADPRRRAQELKKLALTQEQLHKETQELARELKRLNAEQAADKLNRSAGQMEQSARRLQQGQEPEEEQEEALQRINDAQQRIQQEHDRVEEELAREKLAKAADQLKHLKERQESAIAEAERIHQEVLQRQGWDRVRRIALGDLAGAQQALGQETTALAEGKMAGAQVFARVLVKAGQAMDQAAQRMRRQVEAPADDLKPDTQTARLQQEALRRLDQLLDALQQEKGQRAGRGGAGQGGGGSAGRANADGIPQLAQLKALRALQLEVNERTARFGKRHPDLDKLTPEEQKDLLAIRKEQQEVADLLDDLTAPDEKKEK